MYLAIAVLFLIFMIGIKFLKLLESVEKPKVYHSDSQYIKVSDLLSSCCNVVVIAFDCGMKFFCAP